MSQLDVDQIVETKDIEKIYSILPLPIRKHSERVAKLALLIYQKAVEMNVYADEPEIDYSYIKYIETVCKYHDIGKVYASSFLLDRLSVLNEDEKQELEEHTFNSSKIFEALLDNEKYGDEIAIAADVAIGHHEQWDGKGYPCAWEKELTPAIARLCAIANSYDNLVLPHYINQKTYTHMGAVEYITANAGTIFDPILATVFNEVQDQIQEMYETFNPKRVRKATKGSRKKNTDGPTSPFLHTLRPIYDIDNSKAMLLELILELEDQKLGIIAPSKYFQIAEKSNRIFRLNELELDHAIGYVKILRNRFLSDCVVEVEVSYRQLQKEKGIQTAFKKIIEFLKHNPEFKNHLCLTFDSYAFSEGRVNKTNLDILKAEGFKICFKENETIHNVSRYLELYQPDYIKINERLLKNISFIDRDRLIFNHVIQMIRSFKITPIIYDIRSSLNLAAYREAHVAMLEGSYFQKDQRTITDSILHPKNLRGTRNAE